MPLLRPMTVVALATIVLFPALSTLAPAASTAAGAVTVTSEPTADTKPKPKPKPKPVTVRATVSAPSVLTGDVVTVRGKVSKAGRGKVVQLQAYRNRAWVDVAKRRTNRSTGVYSFAIKPGPGSHRLRVYRKPTTTARTGTSPSIVVLSEPCVASSRPRTPTTPWFSNPQSNQPSQIATQLSRVFCAAAPGSTINVAMYFIRLDAETRPIIVALQRMAKYRKVKVNFVLERPAPNSYVPTLARLRSFGTVSLCSSGCRNESATPSINHQKLITMSDTTWAAGRDPVAITGSANWSFRQLRQYRQHAVLEYRNRALVNQLDLRFRSMQGCARTGGCASWTESASRSSHAIEKYRGVWVDRQQGARATDPGTGTTVTFTPQKSDTFLAELAGYECRPGSTVRMSMYFANAGRGAAAARKLHALQAQGCDVQVLFGVATGPSTAPEAIEEFERRGISVRCVDLLHSKFTLVDAYRGGSRHRVLYEGSQNLDWMGVYTGDEMYLTRDYDGARGAAKSSLGAMIGAFKTEWRRAASLSSAASCPRT